MSIIGKVPGFSWINSGLAPIWFSTDIAPSGTSGAGVSVRGVGIATLLLLLERVVKCDATAASNIQGCGDVERCKTPNSRASVVSGCTRNSGGTVRSGRRHLSSTPISTAVSESRPSSASYHEIQSAHNKAEIDNTHLSICGDMVNTQCSLEHSGDAL